MKKTKSKLCRTRKCVYETLCPQLVCLDYKFQHNTQCSLERFCEKNEIEFLVLQNVEKNKKEMKNCEKDKKQIV